MPEDSQPHNLEQVLDRVEDAADGTSRVSVEQVLESLGQRSFGPLMLVPSLIVISPVGGIPGLPTVLAVIIALVAVQMLVGRQSVWLPDFLLSRSISRDRLEKVSNFTMKVASYIDMVVSPRLTVLVTSPFDRVIAATILALCMLMPPLELIPFGNSTTGAAIGVFALALVARDGLLAAIAFVMTAGVIWLAVSTLLV
jgi:hypothetical protein